MFRNQKKEVVNIANEILNKELMEFQIVLLAYQKYPSHAFTVAELKPSVGGCPPPPPPQFFLKSIILLIIIKHPVKKIAYKNRGWSPKQKFLVPPQHS